MNDLTHQQESQPGVPPRSNATGTSWRVRGWRVLRFVALSYTVFIIVLMINEHRLVYPGSKYPRGNWNPDFPMEEISFQSQDGTPLVGWYLPFPGATETALVCHGNGENVAQSSVHTGLKFQSALNANVFVFDYRGFGKSEGSPFEQGVLEDAEAALAWLNEKTNTRPGDVVMVGHSIGGGPAVHMADKYGAKALFLQRTFASLVEPAQNKYWFVPVTLIMRNRFESADKIKDCAVPLHQSHGDKDRLVPIESGRKLFEQSPAKLKRFFVNEGQNHWAPLPLSYWSSVREFIDEVNQNENAKNQTPQ